MRSATSRTASVLVFLAAVASRCLAQSSNKLVFAHFIVGLTHTFTANDWKRQCQLAASHNIDAFALNVGADPWQPDQVQSAYDSAGGVTLPNGSPFKVFLSLDMSAIGNNASTVTQWVTRFAPHSNALLVDGNRPLISTFSGESLNLGGSSRSAGWEGAVKAPLAALSPPITPSFVPAWTAIAASSAVSDNPVLDGIMPWQAWPTDNSNMSLSLDQQFQGNAVANQKKFMTAVSPIFFTHYSSKNYIHRSDDNLFVTRWQQLLNMSPQPDMIQIVSWNDYGESHYLVDGAGTPPDGTTWIDGFDHSPWLNMSDYFVSAYKTGSAPAIATDQVFFNYRTHSVNAQAGSDTLGAPANASFSSDNVYASTFLTSDTRATQLQITTGSGTYGFDVRPGVATFSAPFSEGDVTVRLLDGKGKEIASRKGAKPISNRISSYNFNYASEVFNATTGDRGKDSGAIAMASASPAVIALLSIGGGLLTLAF